MSPQIQALKLKLTGLLTSISEQIASKLDATTPAVSAYKLTNPFNLIVTGDATGTQSVSGDTNVSIALTLANTAVAPGVYPKVTVDSKGRVTKGELLLAADIPTLDASKISGGVFDVDRIPNLNAAKITAGTFNSDRIPGLDASKVTAGTFNAARIPALAISKVTDLQTTLDAKLDETEFENAVLLDGSRPMTAPLKATQGVQLGSSQQASIVYNETTRAIEFIIN